jgi:hypothetical protein
MVSAAGFEPATHALKGLPSTRCLSSPDTSCLSLVALSQRGKAATETKCQGVVMFLVMAC